MKPKSLFIVVFFLLTITVSYGPFLVNSQEEVNLKQPDYMPGELIIKFKEVPPKINNKPNNVIGTGLPSIDILNSKFKINSIEKILDNKHGGLAEKSGKIDVFKKHGLDRIYLLKLPKSADIKKIVDEYKNDVNVEYAEPNYIYTTNIVPNDPYMSFLYGLHNTGQSFYGGQIGGVVDADIDAVEAWDIKTGSNNIIIAVIDTGINYAHPDLAANIWVNPGEISGNGIDDDNNGFIDDLRGWDFVNNDNDPMDDNSHGTHVAGTIAAVGNNGIGVVGVNWQAKIMALKFLNSAGGGTTANAVKSIQYASLMGAKIMSNSWGGAPYSQAQYDAIAAANSLGILFVAAAGNNNMNTDISPYYPQSYNIPNIVSVASITSNNTRSPFSNYGLLSVDIAAPGSYIYSTMWGSYGYKSGTSMATPHVSGVFGLVFSNNLTLSIQEARAIVEDSSDFIATDQPIGGRLNAYNALYTRSKIVNNGPYLIKGYILLKSQIFSGGSWQDIGPNINDLANNYQRTIGATDILNIRQLYNSLNFILQEQGHYRIFARFTDKNGNAINTNNGLLEDSFEFDVTTSTSTTTTTILGLSTLYPSDDSFVSSASPSTNYNDRTALFSSLWSDGSYHRFFLKFNLDSCISPSKVTSAELYLKTFVQSVSGCLATTIAPECIRLYSVPDNSWFERNLTASNQPALGEFLDSIGSVEIRTWYSFNVSSIVIGNGVYSFGTDTDNYDLTHWSSKENGTASSPKLVINCL